MRLILLATIVLFTLSRPADSGDLLSALERLKGGDTPTADTPDPVVPAEPVSVAKFVHSISVNNGHGSCTYIGNRMFLTAGHLFRGLSRDSYPVVKIDGEHFSGQWDVSSNGDAAIVVTNRDPGMKAAGYERREIQDGESLTILGLKTGPHQATGSTKWYTNKDRTSRELRLLRTEWTTSGDSGGGVFDADGELVAVHGGSLSKTESLCTPLSAIKTAFSPFNVRLDRPGESVRPERASTNTAQSEWLDGFTGIYLASASWCGPCKTAKRDTVPLLEKAGWTVTVIDTDRERGFVAAFNIQSLPTWIVVQDGKVVARTTGPGMPTNEKPRAAQAPAEGEVVSTLPAEAGPTPYSEVARILGIIKLQPDDVYADIGCGADARWCVAAAETTDCRRIMGIEIDPQRAASARAHVEALGLSGRIEIIEGDALAVDLSDVTVATCYLYSDVLEELRPKLTGMDRFASYLHAVPGLAMHRYGDAFVWNSADQVQQSTTSSQPYAVWGDRAYYGRVCSNPNCQMCSSIQQQLSGR